MINYHLTIFARAKNKFDHKTIVFDFDGTIAEQALYPKIGKPIKKVIDKIRELKEQGYTIIISSCRLSDEEHPIKQVRHELEEIKKWLKKNAVPYDRIWEYDKPYGLAYIDNLAVNIDELGKLDKLLK